MVGQMLPFLHTLESEANDFAKTVTEMMQQMSARQDSTWGK